MELTEMTSVQQRAIPVLLQGRDAMVKSQTGSGEWTWVSRGSGGCLMKRVA